MTGSVLHSIRRRFASSLRIRVLALSLAALAIVGLAAAVSFTWIVDRTVLTLGPLFAERQILYDRHRGLEALRREVALAETLMRSPTIIEWAENEFARDKYARGLAELEHFRRTFVDRSYFFVVERSGNYYFNDQSGTYTGAQRRYTVSPNNPDDSWYYKTLSMGPGCHLNVNHDAVLAVTKVWMNCVVQEGGRVLGLVGTGIDLTNFLRNVVDVGQPGVESMFIDRAGAIQAHRDESLIDFRSLTKTDDEKTTFFELLDDPEDRAAFQAMMSEAMVGQASTTSRFMSINDRRALVGVGYLDELGWHNVTVMDIDKVIDRRLFAPIAALIALAICAMAVIMTLLFKRDVLDRLRRAEETVRRIEAGDFSRNVADNGSDEIGRLASALNRMAGAVRADRDTLEAAVRERTEQLERIAYIDSLSGVLNRRGFIEAFEQEERRARTETSQLGLLILDIDNFKAINDEHGHAAGDEVIAEIGRRLLDVTREQDLCARWGGDEFVVILRGCDPRALAAASSKILDAVRSRTIELPGDIHLHMAVSVGAHLVAPQDTLEIATRKADMALYTAKKQGRNRVVIYDPALHDAGSSTPTVGRVA